ncbi:RNA helicase [Coemansia biformis]|uniref:RNA helicase n=1 Tax=Coemansia biformis TaxID=1286918 RepID=A0A9W8CYS0_9FUNG|nr:RNA helicase [Coemansia biformis]
MTLYLPAGFVAGVALGSAGLNLLFHAMRKSGALATEKQLSWVLTLAICVVVSAGSMAYAVPLLYYNRGIADLVQTDTPSLVLLGLFSAYLVWDLVLGTIYYRSTISVLTGYIHHTLFICITMFAVGHGVSAIFCLLCYNEIPTIVLAAGSVRKQWRSDALFTAVFFATRIVLHVIVMYKFYMHSEHRCVWRLMLLVLPMHVYWFYSALRSTLRRRARSPLLLGPIHQLPLATPETSLLVRPTARLVTGQAQPQGDQAWRERRRGMVRVGNDELRWPQDTDINAEFAKTILARQLDRFRTGSWAYKRCAYFGITRGEFEEWAGRFEEAVLGGAVEQLRPQSLVPLLVRSGSDGLNNLIVNRFFAFLEKEAPHVVKDIRYLREITNLQYPHEWSIAARSMRRRIIMHVGPTNSGKTYHALRRLQEAQQGIYCSPLRLLAYEVYNRMLDAGISCIVITGEDRRAPDFATTGVTPIGYSVLGAAITQTVSCTIEMAPNRPYNVAVIDEIQMIADRDRGWAWTNALLGLRAREVHLCGEPSAVPLVKRICASMDEEVEVREYTRLGSLAVSDRSLDGKWSNIRKGDCVVTFSRASIYETKAMIEERTGMQCAVIYGGLPPESRVEQAKLFNDPTSGYDVLVASDAVGMGINLSIKRVVFLAMEKWDGASTRPISVSLTRQIGGRAGRFKSGADQGTVTTMEARDLKALASYMGQMPPVLVAAGIKPTLEMIETFSHQFPNMKFSQLWSMFCDMAEVDSNYFLCSFGDQQLIAEAIEDLPLSVGERYHLLYAPVPIKDDIARDALRKFASAIARKKACQLADVVHISDVIPKSREEIRSLERRHRVITMYLWLSYHFPETFSNDAATFALKSKCERNIQQALVQLASSFRLKDAEDAARSDNAELIRKLFHIEA